MVKNTTKEQYNDNMYLFEISLIIRLQPVSDLKHIKFYSLMQF